VTFGAAAGVFVARELRRGAAELAPTNIAGKAWRGLRETWNDVRETAADREAELRESFGLDESAEDADSRRPSTGLSPDDDAGRG
jgi:hypothetical protein